MKSYLLLFLAPYFLATICSEDDPPVVVTEMVVQNETSATLVFVTETNNEIDIEIGGQQYIIAGQGPSDSVVPSSLEAFDSIVLFIRDAEGNLSEVYRQDPIDDSLWTFNDIGEFDKQYILVLQDDDLN
ncbi:hypothetical protein [Gilvibacter sediminis]|uniref:hypothetical protein n=1 Tax=Gilvibacter sediminis TaxID=379071 RepID=UPI002350CC6A|nr:hypothetical protein [Gilvibacter sediminis]MDC7998610.1 hypothetical protein [Gilvibacter sediminis]